MRMSLRHTTMLLLAISLIASGCVRRRMTVRSNPPGAQVFVDDQEIGRTPVSTPFVYYGTRRVRLVRDGHETLTTLETISPPWWEWPPLDYISENLWPWELRDERVLDYNLEPQRVVPTQELLSRANDLRMNAIQGTVAPLPVSTQQGSIPANPQPSARW